MILEEDSLLILSYDTATDILSVNWPDLIDTPMPEIENSLHKLAKSIAHFDVKKLLLDLSTSVIGVDENQYLKLILDFMNSLTATRLEKMARVMASNPAQEDRLLEFSRDIKTQVYLPFQTKSFNNKTDALLWLMETTKY